MAAKENAQYKNSVFVDLFYEDEKAEENEASLYNALHEEPLPEGTKIEKFRVEDVLFMNFKNDISFGVEGRVMVFGEHQSTVNENMPLRSLMYIARAYESIVSVSKVRELIQKGDTEAYKHAIQSCINQGILAEYLKKKGSEVVNMLVAEYDYDMDIEVQREEAYQDGEKHGVKLGEHKLLKNLIEKKLSKGYTAEAISEMLEEPLEKIEEIMKELSK